MKRNQVIRLMEYPLTDAGNAERLHEIFGKKWVYMPKFRIRACCNSRLLFFTAIWPDFILLFWLWIYSQFML